MGGGGTSWCLASVYAHCLLPHVAAAKPVVPGPLGEARLRLLSQLVHSVGLNPDRATAAKGPGLPLYVTLV